MESLFQSNLINFRLTMAGSLGLVYATFPSDKISQCVERVRSDFKTMTKSPKIKVNDNLIEYSGFNDSSHAVIKLSVSRTGVQLPMLNISFINLLLLDASHNGLEKINDIGHETFPSLRLFNLSFNAISSVKSYVFTHLREVEILDFSHNCFETFHFDRVLLSHENLKKLFLNDNLLHSLGTTFAMPKMMFLSFLDISNNFLSEFNNYEIQIHHLNMQNNSLKNVAIFDAEKMILNAQNNQLEQVLAPRGSFASLNLSNNSIEYLSHVEIEAAVILNLSNNLIHRWEPSTSDGSSEYDELETGLMSEIGPKFDKTAVRLALQERVGIRAEFLNLANNFIDSITELQHYKNCKELDLENNLLKDVYPHQLESLFPMLKRVNLINNHLTKHDIKRMEHFKISSKGRSFQPDFLLEPVTQKPLLVKPLLPLLPAPFPLLKIKIPTLSPPSINTKIIIDKTESTTPMITEVPRADSTTQIKSIITTTETRSTTESVENVTTEIVHEKSSPVWMFALLFAAIIVSSIIVILFIIKKRRTQSIYRGFNNEAEHCL